MLIYIGLVQQSPGWLNGLNSLKSTSSQRFRIISGRRGVLGIHALEQLPGIEAKNVCLSKEGLLPGNEAATLPGS